MSKAFLKEVRNKNAIEAAILNRILNFNWPLNRRGASCASKGCACKVFLTFKPLNLRARTSCRDSVCKTKLPPIFKIQYEKWYEKREKGLRKRPETSPNNFKPLSCRLKSAGSYWGYGLAAYGMAIFQSPKSIFQRPNFPGNSLRFRRKCDFCQISGSEIWKFRARKVAIPYPQPFHTPLDSLL